MKSYRERFSDSSGDVHLCKIQYSKLVHGNRIHSLKMQLSLANMAYFQYVIALSVAPMTAAFVINQPRSAVVLPEARLPLETRLRYLQVSISFKTKDRDGHTCSSPCFVDSNKQRSQQPSRAV